ncbi:hypothetical protein JCM8097_004951 [Rhodosporidiobolus ruineniae]
MFAAALLLLPPFYHPTHSFARVRVVGIGPSTSPYPTPPPLPSPRHDRGIRPARSVYRRSAGRFSSFCVDANDNELVWLAATHLFVQVLDAFIGNVCELDLVFNFYKVYAILAEVFLAGEVEETSKEVILRRLEELEGLP